MARIPSIKTKPFSNSKAVAASGGLKPVSVSTSRPQVGSAPLPTQAQRAVPPARSSPPPAQSSGYSPGNQGILTQSQASIRAALEGQLAGINNAEDRAANDYGFKVQYDPSVGPNGERKVSSLTVDPSNPFSRAALLQRSYDANKRSSLNSYASSGQLYSGAYQNAINTNTFNNQQASNGLQQSLQDYLLGNEANRNAAVRGAGEQEIAAQTAALERQLAAAPVDPGPAAVLSAFEDDAPPVSVPMVTGITKQPSSKPKPKAKPKKKAGGK